MKKYHQIIIKYIAIAILTLYTTTPTTQAHKTDYADLIEKLMPSVVNIRTTREVTETNRLRSPFFPFIPNQQQQPQRRKATSLGSGFITDKSGVIVTNYHVVKDAEEIFVGLQSDTSYVAKLAGYDERTDIAVLKIENTEEKFIPVKFGNSNDARVGDTVLAIGNPLGLGGTVTAGIISARGRDIHAGPYDDFIQTDASINKGNSGGPLFNSKGLVIGINTAIFSQSGGSIGIGFAIPSAQANLVINQLLEHGTTKRGWLGVKLQPLSENIIKSLNLTNKIKNLKGTLISRVYNNTPAFKAGIKSGDIVIKFDGKNVNSTRQLSAMVAESPVGKNVILEIIRNNKNIKINVILGELEKALEAIAEYSPLNETTLPDSQESMKINELGITVTAFNQYVKDYFDLKTDSPTTGLVVVDVENDGQAAAIGIQPGMQILKVGQNQITSPQQLKNEIKIAKEKSQEYILLLIHTTQDSRYITFRINQ